MGLIEDGERRTNLFGLGEDGFEIHHALTERHPLHGDAAARFVNDGVAQVKHDGYWAERLHGLHRIFHDEDRIAGIEIRTDELLPRPIDDLARLPAQQVLVILDGELDAGIHGLAAHHAEHLDHGLDVFGGRTGRQMVAIAGQQHAHQRRPHADGAPDAVAQHFDGVVEIAFIRGAGRRCRRCRARGRHARPHPSRLSSAPDR